MKVIIQLLAIIGLSVILVASETISFDAWKQQYGVQYSSSAEQSKRKGIFEKNVKSIEEHNSNPHNTYQKGINQFTAYDDDEFIASFTGYKPTDAKLKESHSTRILQTLTTTVVLPTNWDWSINRTNIVRAVKNQGQCGSCWAFAAVSILESNIALKQNKTLPNLSEQQLVDCNRPPNHGCSGGDHYWALVYEKANRSETQTAYPYTATNKTCTYQPSLATYSPLNFAQLLGSTEAQLQSLLYTNGPIAIAVGANPFKTYGGGIMNITQCPNNTINHVVTLVGYGVSGGVPFWLIKNQWGTTWGEQGYVRITRGNNTCGILTEPVYFT